MFRPFRPDNIKPIENKEEKEKQLLTVVAKEKSVLDKAKDRAKTTIYKVASALSIEKAAQQAGIDPKNVIELIEW